jgi:hypothetical protein
MPIKTSTQVGRTIALMLTYIIMHLVHYFLVKDRVTAVRRCGSLPTKFSEPTSRKGGGRDNEAIR